MSGVTSDTRPRSESRGETGDVSGRDFGSRHRSLHGQGTDVEVIPFPDDPDRIPEQGTEAVS